jgi:hypothetical protein
MVTIKVIMNDGSEKELKFDTTQLPPESKERLVIEGTCTRLVGFAGGKKESDAIEAINAGWQLLVDNNWKDRRKPKEEFSRKEIQAKLEMFPEAEKLQASEILSKMGFL